jgi:hypothetical protein
MAALQDRCTLYLAQAVLREARSGGGRSRPRTPTWPCAGHVLADKAYSSQGIQAYLQRRRIAATIPEPVDQVNNPQRRLGSMVGAGM